MYDSRKGKIELKIVRDSIEFSDVTEMFSERLVIEKNQWGYQKLFVETIGDFIQVYKKEVTTEDFLGSYYELEYMIDPSLFTTGNNYGKIIVRTQFQTLEITISCLRSRVNRAVCAEREVQDSVFHMIGGLRKAVHGTHRQIKVDTPDKGKCRLLSK